MQPHPYLQGGRQRCRCRAPAAQGRHEASAGSRHSAPLKVTATSLAQPQAHRNAHGSFGTREESTAIDHVTRYHLMSSPRRLKLKHDFRLKRYSPYISCSVTSRDTPQLSCGHILLLVPCCPRCIFLFGSHCPWPASDISAKARAFRRQHLSGHRRPQRRHSVHPLPGSRSRSSTSSAAAFTAGCCPSPPFFPAQSHTPAAVITA